jgi:membrane-bound serine protease (ClpP class)
VGLFAGALVMSLVMVRYVLPGVAKVIKGPYLNATLGEALVGSDEARSVEVGQTGAAVTALRPSGKIRIGSRKIDAITQGEFLAPGTPVRVTTLAQNHVTVSAVEPQDSGKERS